MSGRRHHDVDALGRSDAPWTPPGERFRGRLQPGAGRIDDDTCVDVGCLVVESIAYAESRCCRHNLTIVEHPRVMGRRIEHVLEREALGGIDARVVIRRRTSQIGPIERRVGLPGALGR